MTDANQCDPELELVIDILSELGLDNNEVGPDGERRDTPNSVT